MKRGVVWLLVASAIGLFVPIAAQAAAGSDSYWQAPQFTNELTQVNSADNLPCTWGEYTVQGSSYVQRLCTVDTAWGRVSTGGYIQENHTGAFTKPSFLGGDALPVPGTDRLYVRQPSGNGFTVSYYEAADVARIFMKARGIPSPFGAPKVLGYEEQIYFADTRETVKFAHDFIWGNVGFSTNGQWMVGTVQSAQPGGWCMEHSPDAYCEIDHPQDIYVRVRLSDGAIGGFSGTQGKTVSGLSLAITNDGEAVAVSGYNYWKIDLYTFPWGTSMNSRVLRTDYDILLRVFDDRAVGGKYPSNAYFSPDAASLVYNVRHHNPARTDLMKITPSHGEPASPIDNYLALGDSFSSGEGIYTYRPETAFYHSDKDYNLCHQSPLSYGYLINAVVMPERFGSIACSGARLPDISFTGSKSYWESKPQATGKPYNNVTNEQEIKRGFLPGYIDQNTLVNFVKPSVATISIGGNDVGFSEIVKACIINKVLKPYMTKKGDVVPRTCYDNRNEREKLANTVDAHIEKLTKTFQAVRAGMSGEQRLYVVGYPQAISPDFTIRCDIGTPVAWGEREFLYNFTNYLNEAVRLAADNAGAVFVDNSSAFVDGKKDYRLCGNQGESAMNDAEHATKTTKRPGQWANTESFHPTLFGHILMTRQIRRQTNDLTQPMTDPLPQSDWVRTVGDEYRESLVGDTQIKTGKSASYQPNMAADTVYKKGTKNTVQIVQYDARGNARAVLYSEPVELGPLQVSPDGTISGDFTIPDEVPTGYHQLHIMYTDMLGVEKDVYQYVFVGETPGDINGNDIPDEQENCIFSAVAGLDVNGNGVVNECVMGVADAATDSLSPGNDLGALTSSGAITPAEAAMVRSAQVGAKPSKTIVSVASVPPPAAAPEYLTQQKPPKRVTHSIPTQLSSPPHVEQRAKAAWIPAWTTWIALVALVVSAASLYRWLGKR
ncbi:MAG: hypothetical protein WAQ24_02420 [Candidatus Saccharimonadales bacterium]